MKERLKKIWSAVKDSTLVVKGKAIDAKDWTVLHTGDFKDYVVSRFRPIPGEKEMTGYLNDIGQMLLEANTRMDLELLAKNLREVEATIHRLTKTTEKIKSQL